MNTVDNLLKGAFDMHIHSGPGIVDRSINHDEVVLEAMAAGMKGVVIKDHHHDSSNLGFMMEKYLIKGADFHFIPSISLNNHVGGLNPYVVETAINYGARIVWMPTVSAKHHIDVHAQQASKYNTTPKPKKALRENPPITILDGDGKLKPEVKSIITLCRDADVVLANGHVSRYETDLLFEEAKAQGVKRLLLDHPEFLLDCDIEGMKAYAAEGIWVEHILAIIYSNKLTYEYLYEMIQQVGAQYTIIDTDLGQVGRPRPLAGMKNFITEMLKMGITERQISLMIKDNPAKLLF